MTSSFKCFTHLEKLDNLQLQKSDSASMALAVLKHLEI